MGNAAGVRRDFEGDGRHDRRRIGQLQRRDAIAQRLVGTVARIHQHHAMRYACRAGRAIRSSAICSLLPEVENSY